MTKYEVRAFGPSGEFHCGATFRAEGDASAIARFGQLPQTGEKMELYRGRRRLIVRLAGQGHSALGHGAEGERRAAAAGALG